MLGSGYATYRKFEELPLIKFTRPNPEMDPLPKKRRLGSKWPKFGANWHMQLSCRIGVKLGVGFRYSRPPKPLLSPQAADLEGRSRTCEFLELQR